MKLALTLALLLLASLPAAGQTATLVRDIDTGTPWTTGVAPDGCCSTFGSRVFFTSADGQPAVADGNGTGSEVLGDFCPGCGDSSPDFLGSVRGGAVALFTALLPEIDGKTGLYRTDGTRSGTYPLDITFGPFGPFGAIAGDLFFFPACRPDCGLWATDGNASGTRLIHGGAVRGGATAAGRKVFFFLDGTQGSELWTSDGTATGTREAGVVAPPGTNVLSAAGGTAHFYFLQPATGGGTELWASDGTAAGTVRLARFPANPVPSPSLPVLRPIGDRAFLVIDDVVHGEELWESDGTVAGTRRISDFGFAHAFSLGTTLDPPVADLGARRVFAANDGLSGRQMWASDGRPESTTRLATAAVTPPAVPVAIAGGRAVFVAGDPTSPGLWATDGTPAGTRRLVGLCAGTCFPDLSALQPVPLLGRAFFVRFDAARNATLWVTDGTPAGTRAFGPPPPPGTSGRSIGLAGVAAVGRRVFFRQSGDPATAGLWTSDGTPGGARPVPGSTRSGSGSNPYDLVAVGGRLFFAACDGASTEIWSSTGTAASTLPLTHLPDEAPHCQTFPPPGGLAALSDAVLFWYRGDLWRTDATGTTVQLTTDGTGSSAPLVPYGGEVFFQNGGTIWKSDGTPTGTRPAAELAAIPAPQSLDAAGGLLFVVGLDPGVGTALWASDGSAAGTRRLLTTDMVRTPFFAVAGATTYILTAGSFAPGNVGLWKTDGTAAGTSLVSDLGSSAQPVNLEDAPSDPVVSGGTLFFFFRAALYRSDGTAAGTFLLESFHAAANNPPADLRSPAVAFAGRLFFVADDGVHGAELWSSDGTAAGTTLVRDIAPGPASSGIDQLTVVDGRLWFTAYDPVHGVELWTSDGNVGAGAGTRLAADVAPESASSSPDHLTAVGDRLYFTADDGLAGRELWTLDTAAPGACQPGDTRLCLAGNRFQVEIAWKDFQGNTGVGHAVPLTADTGYFWFFSPGNVETVVKVLDARSLNQAFWVFYGALSTVEYAITVTDTETGLTRRYVNPSGELASVGDTNGFGPQGAFDSKRFETPPSALPLVSARTDPRAATGTCAADAEHLCLQGSRFAVTAAWKDFSGHTGTGTAVPLTADTGYFWFFSPTNVEVVTKVLDGRPLNHKFWVFYGALSNVFYTLTVTDTQTGAVKTYKNPLGLFGSVGDTGAFP